MWPRHRPHPKWSWPHRFGRFQDSARRAGCIFPRAHRRARRARWHPVSTLLRRLRSHAAAPASKRPTASARRRRDPCMPLRSGPSIPQDRPGSGRNHRAGGRVRPAAGRPGHSRGGRSPQPHPAARRGAHTPPPARRPARGPAGAASRIPPPRGNPAADPSCAHNGAGCSRRRRGRSRSASDRCA